MSRAFADNLDRLAGRIDGFTRAFGRVVALLGFATVLICFATVYFRYALGIGFTWMQELYTWTHVLLIMLGSAYTLLSGGFVRVDMLYARATRRTQAWVDLLGALLFTMPFLFMVGWYGWPFFLSSFRIGERSQYEDGLPGLYALKATLMIFAALVALQALSSICRNLAIVLGGGRGEEGGAA